MKYILIFVILCATAAHGQNAYGTDYLNLHCTAPDPSAPPNFGDFPKPGLVPTSAATGNAILYCDASSSSIKVSFSGGAYNGIGGGGLPAGLTFVAPTLTVSVAGSGNGAVALSGNTSGTATFTAPAVAGTTSNGVTSSNAILGPNLNSSSLYTYGFTGVSAGIGLNASALQINTAATTVGSLGTNAGATALQWDTTHEYMNQPACSGSGNSCLTFASSLISLTGSENPLIHSTNNTKNVGTSDFTSANSAALQAITGLSYPLGSTAQVFSFHCALMYSQATNVAGDQFGVAVITTAPTNVNTTANVFTNATAVQGGSLNGLATTTPTAVVTFTPGVTSILGATMDGTIETAGGGAATFNVYVLNGTAADVIVVKRGSYCTIY